MVARVGRAHGLRGEVSLQVRTDEPDLRFAPGSRLTIADDAEQRTLVVSGSRWNGSHLLVRFEGVSDRSAAEALRGALLCISVSVADVPGAADEFYDWQLEGLSVVTLAGVEVGVVAGVVHLPGQDLLAVVPGAAGWAGAEGEADAEAAEVLVPFVSAIVPEVDIAAGRIICDPPQGLFPPGVVPSAHGGPTVADEPDSGQR